MTLDKIVRLLFNEINENYLYPNFWEYNRYPGAESEVANYAWDGLSEILKRTRINLQERMIPLYTNVDEVDGEEQTTTFEGLYSIPISDIQKITDVFWIPNGNPIYRDDVITGYTNPAPVKLKVISFDELERLDREWRTRTGEPRYAILYGGNYHGLGMTTENDFFRGRPKIKLYPTPTEYNTELNDTLEGISGDISSMFPPSDDGMGGLMSDDISGEVWGIDVDGDGESDLTPAAGSTDLGVIVQLLNGTYNFSNATGVPFIRYIPEVRFDSFFEYRTYSDGGYLAWVDLSNVIPDDLQRALMWYLVYRCFRKEGEATDIQKATAAHDLYEELVSEYRAENYLFEEYQKTGDTNFLDGYNSNQQAIANNRRYF